jgi:tetratricopeptide (TPR) repeat protein
MKRARLAAGVALGVAALGAALLFHVYRGKPAAPVAAGSAIAPAYVGATACAGCHAAETRAWQGSHHELAMQHATGQSVLGDFNQARYTGDGVTTTFRRRDGQFVVNTDGPDGKLADFVVRYTFGVAPLQQYLVDLPGGRLQALRVAWDSRPREEGGQRWFNLYPGEHIDHKDELHWTRLAQNWNYMCAECHSTDLKKNYDAAGNRFNTTWSEINVACEACHGPASLHVSWAKKEPGTQSYERKGLVLLLDERKGASWQIGANALPVRSTPRLTTIEIDTCARCHSRRSTLTEDYRHGQPLLDTHLPALLTAPLYYPDGQIREEDYEYGSFLQSRMFHQGVTCSDCHEPHSLKLRAPGNLVCLQCHQADKYNSEKHHFHKSDGKGALCVGCHMPTTDYMVVHARHDHSIRIPRPDLSIRLHTPNACNKCHADQSAAWARAKMQQWYGKAWLENWHFGETLFDAQQHKPRLSQDLIAVAATPRIADIARATAASLLPDYLDPTLAVVLPRLLDDASPLVRRAALATVDVLPPQERVRLAAKLLADPVLGVRIEAALVMSLVPRESLTPAQQQALDGAVRDYIAVERSSAEVPQSHVNLGLLYLRQGKADQAEQEYLQAIRLDAAYAPGYVNLADLYRQQQQDAKAAAILLAARATIGDNAAVEHALGLQYVRSRQMPLAMLALAKAVRLAPDNARYAYVYAVALDSNGEHARAVATLQTALALHPYDRDVLMALVGFYKALGNAKAASAYARRLVDIDPRYGSVDQVMEQASSE